MTQRLRVLFAGGGTAGHLHPALAAATVLKGQGGDILFVGTRAGLEAELVPAAGYDIKYITAQGLPRRLNVQLLRALGRAAASVPQSRRIVGQFQPDVVVGTGGYVAGPVLLAARMLGVPTVIHEQNAIPGGTNRFLGRFVTSIAVAYEEARPYFPAKKKVEVVGNPVRDDIVTASRQKSVAALGLMPNKRTVVIMGGSRGARSINEAVWAARPTLHRLEHVQIIHQTGTAGFAAVCGAYAQVGIRPGPEQTIHDHNIRVQPFLHDMPSVLAAADLVVSRAGALAVAEIAARGVASVLVPYPHATADHQTWNARPLAEAGAALLIADGELNGHSLGSAISRLASDQATLRHMGEKARQLGKPEATARFVKHILAAGRS